MKKYSPRFERDYKFYLQNTEKFNFAPYQPIIEASAEGYDAKYCFWKVDSEGKLLPCKEPELLCSLLVCKKSVGFHLKLWTEGFQDMGEKIDYYMAEFQNPPEWVRVSFEKLIFKQYGSVNPLAESFLRIRGS